MRGHLIIDLPELATLEYPLAGVGGRFAAALIDALVQLALMAGGLVLATMIGALVARGEMNAGDAALTWADLSNLTQAALLLWLFLIFWGYHVVFELTWDGQTPGKRILGLRTLRLDGLPVGLTESALRNLLRPIDLLPLFYGVGGLSALLTPLRQRMGDLAAGTVVVAEGSVTTEVEPADMGQDLTSLAVAFMARRHRLSPGSRANLAASIARSACAPEDDPEDAVARLARKGEAR